MKRSVSNKSRSEAPPVAMRRFRICSRRSEKASSARRVSCRAIDSRTRLPSCSGEPGSAVVASQSTRVGLALMLVRSGPQKPCVHRIRGPSEAQCLSYDPSDFALGLDLSYLEEAARSSSRRSDERLSRAGETRKTQEIQLVVARRRGKQPGWGSRVGVPRLLARQDELADRRAGIFIPGLPDLRR